MTEAYINHITTALPPYDVHRAFMRYAPSMLSREHERRLFSKLMQCTSIEHRFSFLKPSPTADRLDDADFYLPGQFPSTAKRMDYYERHAFLLACTALDRLGLRDFSEEVTHVIVTSCTGFYAPGIDWQIVQHYGMKPSVERSIIGFMGCQAAVNALKLARHMVRSEPHARVIILNVELCTLHMQESTDLDQLLAFLIFGDGCAASLVTAEPYGIEIQGFYSTYIPDSSEQITWHIGNAGFEMMLAREVPTTIAHGLKSALPQILGGRQAQHIAQWVVHPGGSSILNAVAQAAALSKDALDASYAVLRDCGNMSSATVMFVLQKILELNSQGDGCAIAFGPGLTAESMAFAT